MASGPINSVQFTRSVMSDFLRPHGLQHARLPFSLLTPGACSNSCPLSLWCHPIISSPVVPFHGKQMGKKMEAVTGCIFLGSKITVDADCSHEIKRCLLLGKKAMTNLESILKSKNITLHTKVRLVKAMIFPVVMYGCERWTIKKGWVPKNWCFWAVVLEKTLESPRTARRANQSILKGINPDIHRKDWFWNWSSSSGLMWRADLLEKTRYWERLRTGEGDDRGWEVGWHHWLNGRGSEQTGR